MADRPGRFWQHQPLGRWLALAAMATLGFSLAFSWLSVDRTRPIEVVDNLRSIALHYMLGFAVLWLCLTLLVLRLRQKKTADEPNRTLGAASVVFLIALFSRGAVLMTTSPLLSDDIWRYLHDGSTLYSNRNPYHKAPANVEFGIPALYRLKSSHHADLVTIYQPLSQWVFRGGFMAHLELARWSGNFDPVGDRSMRAIFIVIDMLIIVLLLRRLRQEGRSVWWAALYAWHPLAISEVAGSGHQDVIGMAAVVAALMFADPRRASQGRGLLAGVALAGAMAVKPLVAPLGVVFAWTLRGRISAVLSGFVGTVLALAAAYIPFGIWDPGFVHMMDTVRRFIGAWEFNNSIHAVLTHPWFEGMAPLMTKPNADMLMIILLGLTVLGCLVRKFDAWRTTMIFFFVGLLLSSTAHPWYLLWALVILPLRFNWGLWVWSLTISWSYFVVGDVDAWHLPVWVSVLEYVPVYLTLLFCAVAATRKPPASGDADDHA